MSPVLIPAPNRAAYLYVNAAGFLILVAALGLLLTGSFDKVRLPLLVMLASGMVVLVGLLIAYASTVNRAVANAELSRSLDSSFSPFAEGIEFLSTDEGDARAVFWKKACCLIPHRLVHDILSPGAGGRGKQTALVTIAHELGHLISRDTQDFMLCRVMFVYGIASAICMWWGLLLGRLEFNPYAVLGLAYITGMFFWMMYDGVRKREFFADRLAAIVGREADVKAVLERRAREEKHLKYPFSYRLTHPLFRARSEIFSAFSKVYDYSYARCLLLSFVVTLYVGLLPFASKSSAVIGGFVAEILFIAFAAWINLYFLFSIVVPATLVGRLSFVGLMMRACLLVAGIAVNIDLLSLTLLNREFFTWAFQAGLLRVDQVIGGVTGILALHVSYWMGARQTLMYRGPKRPDRAFYRRLFWSGGIGGLALASCLTTFGRLVITQVNGEAAAPDDTLGILTSVTAIFAIVALLCGYYWHRYVQRAAALWGPSARSTPQFIEGEWNAHHELRPEKRASPLVTVGLCLLGLAGGLVILPTIAAAAGQDPLTVALAWIVSFPIIVIVSRRNSKKVDTKVNMKLVAV